MQLLTYRLKTLRYICFIDNNGVNQCHVNLYQCRIKLVNGEYVRFVIMMDYTCKCAYISEITLGSVNFIQHCRTNDMLIYLFMADKPCVCLIYPINQCHDMSLCNVRDINIQKLYAWCDLKCNEHRACNTSDNHPYMYTHKLLTLRLGDTCKWECDQH